MSIVGVTKKKILKEIHKQPCHGYDIHKKLKLPISTVYEHLKEIEKANLIRAKIVGKRKIYSLTSKGELLLKGLGEL